MGPNSFVRNENHVYIKLCVTTCAVMSCVHCAAHAHRQASHPYVNVACQKLLMDMPFMPAELYLSKLTTTHFSTLNTKIANQNMLKRILIAMHYENKADCHEDIQDMCRGICRTSVQVVGFNRPVETEILQLQF